MSMMPLFAVAFLSVLGTASSLFVVNLPTARHGRHPTIHPSFPATTATTLSLKLAMGKSSSSSTTPPPPTWSPQDLVKDNPNFLPIPDNDYVKMYQRNPELWPVEFFVIAYRRINNNNKGKNETQILVRESANGTSKWGLGTGVPATRWMLSPRQQQQQEQKQKQDESIPPPTTGYKWSEPRISFEARNYPEFPKEEQKESWTYDKIDICADAFNGPNVAAELQDPELEEYAMKIRNELRTKLSNDLSSSLSSWEASVNSIVKSIVDNDNSLAAIQGTLRMSGLFARKGDVDCSEERFINPSDNNAPDPAKLIQSSMRIYTMFPQMPDPMPLPSTPPKELQEEITSRDARMAETGRDPHKDKYGRVFTHRSTSNVSNTIHGVYFVMDVTDLLGGTDNGNDVPPALNLFGTNKIKREWKSLEDLKVLDADGEINSTEDTKPTFISGFIVRQLVKEGIINI